MLLRNKGKIAGGLCGVVRWKNKGFTALKDLFILPYAIIKERSDTKHSVGSRFELYNSSQTKSLLKTVK